MGPPHTTRQGIAVPVVKIIPQVRITVPSLAGKKTKTGKAKWIASSHMGKCARQGSNLDFFGPEA